MDYTIHRMIANAEFDAVDARTRAALTNKDFGILTEIDVKATMQLDVEMPAYRILGACNPKMTHQAIRIEPRVGAMLPCNVILREIESGVEVSAITPVASKQAVERPLNGRQIIAAVLTTLVGCLLLVSAAAAQEAGASGPQGAAHAVGWIDSVVHWTVRAIEIVGIVTIVIGSVASVGVYLYRTARKGPVEEEYQKFRAALGRSILLGLEFLVAADIINTVAIDPTLESVAVLAAVVLVRTFLSFALEVEIDGSWPWNKGKG